MGLKKKKIISKNVKYKKKLSLKKKNNILLLKKPVLSILAIGECFKTLRKKKFKRRYIDTLAYQSKELRALRKLKSVTFSFRDFQKKYNKYFEVVDQPSNIAKLKRNPFKRRRLTSNYITEESQIAYISNAATSIELRAFKLFRNIKNKKLINNNFIKNFFDNINLFFLSESLSREQRFKLSKNNNLLPAERPRLLFNLLLNKLENKFIMPRRNSSISKSVRFNFLCKIVDSFKYLHNAISLSPWGSISPLAKNMKLNTRFARYARKLTNSVYSKRTTLHKHLFTLSKLYTDMYWKDPNVKRIRSDLHLLKKQLDKLTVKSFRRKWYAVFKSGKYWQRFRKKPTNWGCYDWKNKFFRLVDKPLNAFPLPDSKDVERRSIYRYRLLKDSFKYKFLIKRYLRRTLFNNKLTAVTQFLKNKYKKKKCTFWEKTYRHLLGRADMILCWHGYTNTLTEARDLISRGGVYINGSRLNSYKSIIYPSDVIYIYGMESFIYNKEFTIKDAQFRRRFKLTVLDMVFEDFQRKGMHKRFINKFRGWWKNLVKKLERVQNSLTDFRPKWLYSFFEKSNCKLSGYKGVTSLNLFSVLNYLYFERKKKFLPQRNVKEVNPYLLKFAPSIDYFLNEHTSKRLEAPQYQDTIIENKLADFSFNYLMPNDRFLLKHRHNAITYKASTNTLTVNKDKLDMENYFDLSKFKNDTFSKNMYMFYLSRVFY